MPDNIGTRTPGCRTAATHRYPQTVRLSSCDIEKYGKSRCPDFTQAGYKTVAQLPITPRQSNDHVVNSMTRPENSGYRQGEQACDENTPGCASKLVEAFFSNSKNGSEPLTMELQIETYKNGSTLPPLEVLNSAPPGELTMAFYQGAREVQNILRWAMYDFDANRNGILEQNEIATSYGAANKLMHPFIGKPLDFVNKNFDTFARLSGDGDRGKVGITVDDIDQISNYDSYFKKQTWQTNNPNPWWFFLTNPSTKTEYRKLFEQMNSEF